MPTQWPPCFLGLDDPEFVKPSRGDLARRNAALFESNSVTVRTTAGDFTALLNRDAAPNTSIQSRGLRWRVSSIERRPSARNPKYG